MTFKDLRQGHPVYLLHKGEEMTAQVGKVKQVGTARFPQYGTTGSNALGMVIDVTIDEKTYVVPADSQIASAGNVVVSVDKEGILREVEILEAESEEALNSIEKHRKRKEECEKIKEEWNPELAEKKQQDERIGKIEGKVDSLAEMLKAFINKTGTMM